MTPRRGAFDPTRLDEANELLGPPPAPPSPASSPPPAAASQPDFASSGEPRRPRGEGGRPPGQSRGGGSHPRRRAEPGPPPAAKWVTVAVRIPRPLYDQMVRVLLDGFDRPSYGQVIAWTCEDHPDEVVATIREATGADRRRGRVPRGRRLAAEVVPLALRVDGSELAAIDAVIDQASSDQQQKVTRTAAVVAAVQVALRHAPGP